MLCEFEKIIWPLSQIPNSGIFYVYISGKYIPHAQLTSRFLDLKIKYIFFQTRMVFKKGKMEDT